MCPLSLPHSPPDQRFLLPLAPSLLPVAAILSPWPPWRSRCIPVAAYLWYPHLLSPVRPMPLSPSSLVLVPAGLPCWFPVDPLSLQKLVILAPFLPQAVPSWSPCDHLCSYWSALGTVSLPSRRSVALLTPTRACDHPLWIRVGGATLHNSSPPFPPRSFLWWTGPMLSLLSWPPFILSY